MRQWVECYSRWHSSEEGRETAVAVLWMEAMKISSALLVVAMLIGISGACRAADKSKIIVVESADAPGRIASDRVEDCLRLLSHEAGTDADSLPLIVVMHVSQKEAAEAGFFGLGMALRRNSNTDSSSSFYELWLIGEPLTTNYVQALNVVIEQELRLRRNAEEQKRVVARVTRWLDATVSAHRR